MTGVLEWPFRDRGRHARTLALRTAPRRDPAGASFGEIEGVLSDSFVTIAGEAIERERSRQR